MKYNSLTPKLSQDYTKIEKLSTLKPLTMNNNKSTGLPCIFDLLLLSANLNYQAKLIMDDDVKGTGDLSVIKCINKSLEIMAIVDNYENIHITYTELKQIKKDFKLNKLYAN